MERQDKQEINLATYQKWEGPLPSPDALIRYNDAVPGAAERILTMAEEEMKHRHKREDKLIKDNSRLAFVSTIFGFLSVILLTGIVAYALYKNNVTAAIGTIIGAIAAVAGLFTYGKFRSSKVMG